MTTDTANDRIREQAARWAERLMDSDLTAAEREALQHWLIADKTHEREFRAHTMIVNLAHDLPGEVRAELLAAADERPRRVRRTIWIAGLAASLFFAMGLTAWFLYRPAPASIVHVTPADTTREVTLPDGSVAHLNARTDLRWIERSNERHVALLEGEALFEVTPDAAKPFTVALDDSEIRVLGTRFNVRRRESSEIVVTVLEGTVAVSHQRSAGIDQPGWSRTLRADEQIVFNAAELVRDVHSATGANAARWREGILEFEDESLSTIVADLARSKNRQIVVKDPRVAELRLGGQLNVRDDIEASLGLLEKLAPVTAHRSGDTFVLDYRQNTAEETR